MKHSKHFVTACILIVIFLLAAVQPILAAERIIKMVVPGCE
jgi:hypothetical protein